MNHPVLLWLFVSLSSSVSFAASPPWKKCPPSESNVEECLIVADSEAIKNMAHGSESGLVDFDPIKYDKLSIIDTNTGPFRGKLIYSDVVMNGFSKVDVKKIEKRPDGLLRIEMCFPKANITGKYVMDTALLAVPMKGHGDFLLNIGDNVNKLLNENWKTLAKELGPITVKAFNPDAYLHQGHE